jgi:hypothetical protein
MENPRSSDPAAPPPPGATFVGRLLGRRGPDRAASPAPSGQPDDALSSKLDALQTQLNYLETVLEGLQDAVHRRSELDDRRNEELMRRIEPARLIQEITSDARRRGV